MNKIKTFFPRTEYMCKKTLEQLSLEHETQVELYVDLVPKTPMSQGVKRFICLLEPAEIANTDLFYNIPELLQLKNNYTCVFTHNQDILDKLGEQAILFPYGTSWVENYEKLSQEKKFGVSTLISFKNYLPGHAVRYDLWGQQHRIKIPTQFWIGGDYHNGGPPNVPNLNNNPVLKNSGHVSWDKFPKKNRIFDYQFHIVIENAKRRNWFTEKIIDCFQTKSIPIYWGCPNIGEFSFNTDGIIFANDVEDIINICNSLTPDDYIKRKDAIEENYHISMRYINLRERMKEQILKLL